MKRLLIASAIIIACGNLSAQSGIYQTADDYINGNLAYQQEANEKHAIRTDIPFDPSAVKVVKGSDKHAFDKWNLYGYKKKNRDYRFFESKSFRIIDPSHFPIYAREVNVVNGKAKTRETKYYFSRTAESPIMELTINNLKHAFPSRDFHYLIDLQFSKNKELLAYDAHYGEYKLKSLFNSTFN